jgi:hypothetical protein
MCFQIPTETDDRNVEPVDDNTNHGYDGGNLDQPDVPAAVTLKEHYHGEQHKTEHFDQVPVSHGCKEQLHFFSMDQHDNLEE